jgi:hypothetical protein
MVSIETEDTDMLTQHDISMNRYVINMRREKVRQGIKSARYYREIGDRRGNMEATMYVRGVYAEYRATMKALVRA